MLVSAAQVQQQRSPGGESPSVSPATSRRSSAPEVRPPSLQAQAPKPKLKEEKPKVDSVKEKMEKERAERAALDCWEVLLDGGWVPFRPGCKFKDEAGTQSKICNGKFWYNLVFDESGNTGKQINCSSGKTRQLRKMLNGKLAPPAEPAAPALPSQPEQQAPAAQPPAPAQPAPPAQPQPAPPQAAQLTLQPMQPAQASQPGKSVQKPPQVQPMQMQTVHMHPTMQQMQPMQMHAQPMTMQGQPVQMQPVPTVWKQQPAVSVSRLQVACIACLQTTSISDKTGFAALMNATMGAPNCSRAFRLLESTLMAHILTVVWLRFALLLIVALVVHIRHSVRLH